MSSVMGRTLGILELLARQDGGLELGAIAQRLGIPPSGVHRLLAELIELGFVRQVPGQSDYMLTTKLMSLGLMFLNKSGIADAAQPLLDSLAEISGELVRLSVVDNARLTWVARAQGARSGLRYDPDMGTDAWLSCTSSGWAWLSTLGDDDAIAKVVWQGLGQPADFGPNAPPTLTVMLEKVREARRLGYAMTEEVYTAGLNAVSVAVRIAQQPALGVLTIAGPTVRLTRERMEVLVPPLQSHAQQLAAASSSVPFFHPGRRPAAANKADRKPIYAA